MKTQTAPARTTEQNARFHQLVSHYGLTIEEKKALVRKHTQNRVESSKLMHRFEMAAAIRELEQREIDSLNRMRTKVNALARDLGWIKPNPYTGKDDFQALNAFIRKKNFGTWLFDVPPERLPDLITALERVIDYNRTKAVFTLL